MTCFYLKEYTLIKKITQVPGSQSAKLIIHASHTTRQPKQL